MPLTRACITLPYKSIDEQDILLDVYPPLSEQKTTLEAVQDVPALVYFHGGALAVGSRKSWFPEWLYKRCTQSGCAFISADYRLLAPCTGHDILQDVIDVFSFISSPRFTEILSANEVFPKGLKISSDNFVVAGTSAGGLCAYLAGLHATPKPKAILALYAQGGNLLTPHYFQPKTQPFFRGRELLDPSSFTPFLYPYNNNSIPDHLIAYKREIPDLLAPSFPTSESALPPAITSASELSYDPQTNFPTNPRMLLGRLYLQLGEFLDYYTGLHAPSLSRALETAHSDDKGDLDILASTIAVDHHRLFPLLALATSPDVNFPPTCFLHGSIDTAVPVGESKYFFDLLQSHDSRLQAQNRDILLVIDGQEHSFDYEMGAEEMFGKEFDKAWEFLQSA